MSDVVVTRTLSETVAWLAREIERLRGALRPFAALPVLDLGQCQRHPEERVFAINGTGFTANDVLAAKEALGYE